MYNFKQDLEEIFKQIPIVVIDIICSYLTFTPSTKEELEYAVNLWCEDKEIASNKYGLISKWNTILIKDMSYLFSYKYYFNENINDWNVTNVKNDWYIFRL